MHGEASRIAALAPPGSRILDAGCGTGRVAIRLAELGYRCTGIDSDPSMLAVARAASNDVTWIFADLADLADLADAGSPDGADGADGPFDLVVAAGNVIPLLGLGTPGAVVRALASRLDRGGLFVTGFGLDRRHLPPSAALVDLADYDDWCLSAELALVERALTWDGEPYAPGDGYVVSVHVANGRPVRPATPKLDG